VAALAVDAQGYLYVGYNYFYETWSKYCRPCKNWVALVWAFAPGASGNATPAEQWTVECCSIPSYVGGLVLDGAGDLLVSVNGKLNNNCVETFATPATSPKLIRTLTGSGIVAPYGLAVDGNELYVVNSYGASQGWFVSAYPFDANGSRDPDREIQVAGQMSIGVGIAVGAGRLFVPDPKANSVYELDATKGGTQQPLAMLNVPTAIEVKLGQ
jgi:hypothetical protein